MKKLLFLFLFFQYGFSQTIPDNVKKLMKYYPQIIGFKDSSGDEQLFSEMVKARKAGKINFSIFQGLENKLFKSTGCDGFMIAMANVEPELCREIFLEPEKADKIFEKFWEYNLGGNEWFISLKAILYAKDILRSSEQAGQGLIYEKNSI